MVISSSPAAVHPCTQGVRRPGDTMLCMQAAASAGRGGPVTDAVGVLGALMLGARRGGSVVRWHWWSCRAAEV